MRDLTLHKVNLTPETVFDYEYCLRMRQRMSCENCTSKCGGDWSILCPNDAPTLVMPKAEYKRELEEYIQRSERHKHKHYFRAVYLDERTGETLMLFMRRGQKFSLMQTWDVVGIMPASEWNEEDEDDGVYRNWYNTRITAATDYDWVEEYRTRQELEAVEQKLEEVYKLEHKQQRRAEHDRKFDKKTVKKSQAQLVATRSTRKRIESERTVFKERYRRIKSKAGIFR